MFMVIRKSDTYVRKTSESKDITDYIPSDIADRVSLEVMEVVDYAESEIAEYNRIYYVFDGELQLLLNDKETLLYKGDAAFFEKGMAFALKGTFKVFIISHPELHL